MTKNTTKKIYSGLRSKKALTLVELVISVLIAAILGGAVVSSLWTIFHMFDQTNEYVAGRQEIEFVVQRIGREISNVGLGMPNNRQGKGSFADAFSAASATNEPFMAKMGAVGEDWGGPVTLSLRNAANNYSMPGLHTYMVQARNVTIDGRTAYGGPELYYAWGISTGIKVFVDGAENPDRSYRKENVKKKGANLTLRITPADLAMLQNNFNLAVNDEKNPDSWVLFPTSRLPMLIRGIATTYAAPYTSGLNVTLAPHSQMELKAPLMGMDEIFLPRVSRIFLDDQNRVVQHVFGSDYDYADTTKINLLAHGIAGLYFVYEPDARILSMYIASQGDARVNNAPSVEWPIFAGSLPHAGQRRHLVNRIDWRIRN